MKSESPVTGYDPSLTDRLDRPLHDLRISVTDRCNFRCVYCMPKATFGNDYAFIPKTQLLSHKEILKVVGTAAKYGVTKIRLTGGEPLVRSDLESVVENISKVDGIVDVCLTTNASLLTPERARSLASAGINRINISLDSLDDKTFKKINDVNVGVKTVLDGINSAQSANFQSVKVNMVVKKDLNDHSIPAMADYFRNSGVILRFIEFMDVGNSNQWNIDKVTTSQEIADLIHQTYPIVPLDRNYPGEVAERWEYCDGGGEIGIISSITKPFCGDCTRARLSATGTLYTCLFASSGHDLREYLTYDGTEQLDKKWREIWKAREDRYSESRTHVAVLKPKIEMSFIGG